MMIMSGLFVNAAILISSIVCGTLLLNTGIMRCPKWIQEIAIGILSGILGCVLMIYSVKVSDTQIIDFRLIAVVLVAIYFSPKSAVLTATIISLFRIIYYGASDASFVAVTVALFITLSSGIVASLRIERSRKWFTVLILNIVISFFGFRSLSEGAQLRNTFLPYLFGIIILYVLIHKMMEIILFFVKDYKKAQIEAKHDFLTNLLNSRQIEKILTEFGQNKDKHSSFALLYLDIDNFKIINDNHGHIEGDRALKYVANVLLLVFDDAGYVSRRGGDEFMVFIPDCTYAEAEHLVSEVKRILNEKAFMDENKNKVYLNVSAGIAAYPDPTDRFEDLIRDADASLYASKKEKDLN